MKNPKFKFVVVLTLLIFLVVGILIGVVISNDKESCKSSPFIYGINMLEELNEANFTCSCMPIDSNLEPFSFDNKGIFTKNNLLN